MTATHGDAYKKRAPVEETKPTILTKEMILAADDLPKELVQVPEWGGAVWVKAMSGAERDGYEAMILDQRGKDTKVNLRNARAKLAMATVVDAEGKRLFGMADIEALSKKSAAALQRIFDVATRLSGISDEDLKELTESLEENPFDGSPSA